MKFNFPNVILIPKKYIQKKMTKSENNAHRQKGVEFPKNWIRQFFEVES